MTVVIKNFAYIPRDFTIPPGATVTVRNDDQVIHTLTADTWTSNKTFNTGDVTHGLATTFQAPKQPGTYPFHDIHYPYMAGILTVS